MTEDPEDRLGRVFRNKAAAEEAIRAAENTRARELTTRLAEFDGVCERIIRPALGAIEERLKAEPGWQGEVHQDRTEQTRAISLTVEDTDEKISGAVCFRFRPLDKPNAVWVEDYKGRPLVEEQDLTSVTAGWVKDVVLGHIEERFRY